MPTLTSTELTELQALIPSDVNAFKTAYDNWVSDPNAYDNPAAEYYQYLAGKGFDYGTLAMQVAINDQTKAFGQIANYYAASYAESQNPSIDLSVGSDDWLTVQWTLMNQDWAFRDDNTGSELTYTQQEDAHEAAFAEVGLKVFCFQVQGYALFVQRQYHLDFCRSLRLLLGLQDIDE